MERQDAQYRGYVALLRKELVPAVRCTEPIVIAYTIVQAAARLKGDIKQVDIYTSGNIIKNIKSVTVSNTGGCEGIQSAAATGIIADDLTPGLEVISHVRTEQIMQMKAFLERTVMYVYREQCSCALWVGVRVSGDKHTVLICIQNEHSSIIRIEGDGRHMLDKGARKDTQEQLNATQFSMQGIYEFTEIADLTDVKEILDRQIQCSTVVAEEGLAYSHGTNIGSVLLSTYDDSIQIRARALAAAGSDARISGYKLSVIISGGSGSQGMTCSPPVIVYVREFQSSEEQLYRALFIFNLPTLYQRKYIGRLPVYCGAVSADAGVGARIAYLLGGDCNHACHATTNALAITSGMICDDARPFCAAEIATAVDAGTTGCMMYQRGKQSYCGKDIVCRGIEETTVGVGQLARDGMKGTDDEIMKLMIQS